MSQAKLTACKLFWRSRLNSTFPIEMSRCIILFLCSTSRPSTIWPRMQRAEHTFTCSSYLTGIVTVIVDITGFVSDKQVSPIQRKFSSNVQFSKYYWCIIKTLVPVKEKTPLGNTNKWQLYEILESGVTKLGEHKKQCKDDFSLRLQSWKTECSDKNKSTRKTCCEQIVTTSRYVCKYY